MISVEVVDKESPDMPSAFCDNHDQEPAETCVLGVTAAEVPQDLFARQKATCYESSNMKKH